MKFKVSIKSVFTEISEQIFVMRDIKTIQTFVVDFIDKKEIDDNAKSLIKSNIMGCKSVFMAQKYICNSLLRYEGLSVNKYDSGKKEVVEE